jgi:plastocyanin
MMGGADGWWIVMWMWMAAFWIIVIAAVVWLSAKTSHRSNGGVSVSEILKRRLATGEIDREEYQSLKKELVGDHVAERTFRVPPVTAVALLALALLLFIVAPVWAAGRGGWDMWDYMQSMHGAGRDTSGASLSIGGKSAEVKIRDFAFSPGNLRVPVGGTVTWTNRDSAQHNATAQGGTWRTQTLSNGERDAVTFDRAGEYDYYCSIHPSMKAHLSVQ